ncbi:MAG: hypothetical protein H6599_10735 [Flavobacteriales bacterium]|nr:hypothetical protein [Flavobacteriales bacterium]
MNTLFKFLFLLFLIISVTSCSGIKDQSNKNTPNITDTEMLKISPDGNINAKMDCVGSSQIELIKRNGNEWTPNPIKCTINNSNTLLITFSCDEFDLILELYEAGSMPIQTGEYRHMTKGTNSYAIIRFINKTNGIADGDLTLEIYEGSVIINDYGMSSNILCGEFNIFDTEGNSFKGVFNESVSNF